MAQVELAGRTEARGAARADAGAPAWPAAAVLAGFATLLVLVGRRHEPWFDEAQAWLIARDSSLWDMLAHRVAYEGTPGLWHCILWLAMRCGLPFSGLWLISAALAVGGAAIVLFRAPFPFWMRVGIVFSYFFAYQYAIVARSYALDLVFIPLLAAMFAQRMQRPAAYCLALGLCANANAHSFIIAGLLFAELALAHLRRGLWREPRFVLACAAFALLGGAAILQALPPPDASFAAASPVALVRALEAVREAFLDRLDVLSMQPPADAMRKPAFVLSLALLVPSFLLFRRAGTQDLVGAAVFALLAFYVAKFANAWHAGFLYLVWVFGLWVSWHAMGRSPAWLRFGVLSSAAALLLVNDGYTVAAWTRELEEAYSAGPAAADVLAALRAAHPQTRIAAVGFKAFSLQPWFDKNVFDDYNDGAAVPAFYEWRRSQSLPPVVDLAQWEALIASQRYDVLVLSAFDLADPPEAAYTAAAARGGFCPPLRVAGGLIWKSYVRESDALLVFSRCPTR